MPAAEILRASKIVEDARAKTAVSSTQENAFMVLAAEALADKSKTIALSVDGVPQQGALFRTWRAAALANKTATIANSGQAPVSVVLTTSGNPLTPEPAAEQGYRIERAYYTLDGKPIEPTAIKQNDRFAVALTITENEAAFARLLLVDRLPAGLEIDNPDLFEGGSTEAPASAGPWACSGPPATGRASVGQPLTAICRAVCPTRASWLVTTSRLPSINANTASAATSTQVSRTESLDGSVDLKLLVFRLDRLDAYKIRGQTRRRDVRFRLSDHHQIAPAVPRQAHELGSRRDLRHDLPQLENQWQA
jgi:hypothetical protein